MTILSKVTPLCVAPPPPPLVCFVLRFLAASSPAHRRRRLLLARGTITLTGVIYLPIISHSRHAQPPRSVTVLSASSPLPLPFPPNFSSPLLILLNFIPSVQPRQEPLPSPSNLSRRRADEKRLGPPLAGSVTNKDGRARVLKTLVDGNSNKVKKKRERRKRRRNKAKGPTTGQTRT